LVTNLVYQMVSQKVKRLVTTMARMMGKHSQWVNHLAHCSGRNYLTEIRLEILMVHPKVKRWGHHLVTDLVSWRAMKKEKRKVRYWAIDLVN